MDLKRVLGLGLGLGLGLYERVLQPTCHSCALLIPEYMSDEYSVLLVVLWFGV